jgi:lysophospholipase L1-like esterase
VTAAGLVAGSVWAAAAAEPPPTAAPGDDWVRPMRDVHARFKGEAGTFAHFGDSITISMAFWSSLQWDRKNMDPATQAAFDLVKATMKEACWREWKGPKFGNQGSMTIRWARENVDAWLKDLNPECALIMFGTNDLGPLEVEEYEAKTREVVKTCLDNGTVVILSTIPPKRGRDEKCKRFVEAVRRVARDMKVPLCDYYEAVVRRRPDDWDGGAEQFKSVPGGTYEVPTLISRDGTHPSNPKQWQGDYSAEGLRHNGFVLRNYVVLHAYARVVRQVLKPGP